MHDEPTIQQLFESLRDYLMKEIMPLCKEDQALAFRNLVAWNMLGVMSRELENKTDNAGLISIYAKLLSGQSKSIKESRDEVAKAIREGKITWENQFLIDAMLKDVDQRLVVSNPRFTRDVDLEKRLEKS